VTGQPLGVPLACLLAAVLWTIGLVVAPTVARFRHLAHGGTVREFGMPDDRRLFWRLYRAHQNALESVRCSCCGDRPRRRPGGRPARGAFLARVTHTLVRAAPGRDCRAIAAWCVAGLAVLALLPGA
jgi:hypothetical protein